ncbi:MAG TPA: gluconate 2-dehydrogenase subunit 3 family protein [Gemmatimonadaceae bacterium]|nr:gluconate 2-dehydrogenase subunit 3 family protein [Gemmatimonadaceae bacterium]
MTSRRDTVRALAGIAALPLLGTAGVDELLEIGRHAHERAEARLFAAPRALTAEEYDIVVQASERIIPRTATPGATEARVADFIDVMLADWYDSSDRERFKAGLGELDARARALSGIGFSKSTERQQTEILEKLDRELHEQKEARAPGADDHWYATLKYLTIWGYYTSRPGIVEELRVQLLPGKYDGNAGY